METKPDLTERSTEAVTSSDAIQAPRRFQWDDSDLNQLKQRIAQQRHAKQVMLANTPAPTNSEGAPSSCETTAQPQELKEQKPRTALKDRYANPAPSRQTPRGAGATDSKIPRPAQTQKQPRDMQLYKSTAERKRKPVANIPDFSKLHKKEQERISRFKKSNRKATRPMAIALATGNLPPRHNNGRSTAPSEEIQKSAPSTTSKPAIIETTHLSDNALSRLDLPHSSKCHKASQLRITVEPITSTSNSHGTAQAVPSNIESDTTDTSTGVAKEEFHADPASLARILSDQPLHLRRDADPSQLSSSVISTSDAQVRHSMYVGAFSSLGISVPENWRRITSIAAASGHTDLNELFNNERRDSIFGPPLRAKGVCVDYAATPMTPRSNRVMAPVPTPASQSLHTPRSRAIEHGVGLLVGTTPTQRSIMPTVRSIPNSTPAPLRMPMQISATPMSSQHAGRDILISAQTPMPEPPFRSGSLVSRQNPGAQPTLHTAFELTPLCRASPYAEISVAAATPATLRGPIPTQQTSLDPQSPPKSLCTVPVTPGSKRVHFADAADEATPSRTQYLAPSRAVTSSVTPNHRTVLSGPMTPTESNSAQFGNCVRTPASQTTTARARKRNLQADFDVFSTPVTPKKPTADANSCMASSVTANLGCANFTPTGMFKSHSRKKDESPRSHPVPVKRPLVSILKLPHQNGVSEIDEFASFCEIQARQCSTCPQDIEHELLSIEEQRLSHEINTILQASPAPGCATTTTSITARQLFRFECPDPLIRVLNSASQVREVFEDDEDRFDTECPPQLVTFSGSTTASVSDSTALRSTCSDQLVLYSVLLSGACRS